MLAYANTQYLYTSNGELKVKIEGADTTHYTYDYFGNLITVVLPNSDRIDYIIDGQSRRIGKKLNGTIVKKWIYSGQLTPVAELDSAGNVAAQFVGNYMIKNGNTYRLITDHLGSVRLVVDVNTGNIAQQIDYDEYGNVTQNTNPDFQPFAYAGGLYDTQTKLVRFGARDYDAKTGRWICKDPVGFEGRTSNLFEYCLDDPINNIDPDGLQSIYYSHNAERIYLVNNNGAILKSWEARDNFVPGNNDKGQPRASLPNGDYIAIAKSPGVKYGKSYGTFYIDTGDLRGRDIHGGGNNKKLVPDPYASEQGWVPTFGCIRMQNENGEELSILMIMYGGIMPLHVQSGGYKGLPANPCP
jgi:RHS repeat-associated protein